MNLKDFDYIVCDECHYFFTDATFNKFTDVSLKKILESNAIKIFMSATPRIVKKYIQKEVGKDNILAYSLTTDYSYISQLYFYHSSQVIEDNLLDNLKPDEKVIYFNRSAEDCYRLRKKYKNNSMFVVSESNSLYKFVDEQAKQQILKTKKLQRQILFTTSCMDNGINIEDKSIKHIIIDIRDIDTLIQCLGRKRIEDEEDTITLYIRHVDNRQLGGMVTGGKNKLAIADELDLLGTEKWIKKYPKEKLDTGIIYYGDDKELHVNQVAYMKYQDNVKVAEALLGLSKDSTNKIQREYQYASIVARKLNCQWSVYDTLFKRREFEQYLEENVGKRLSKEKQLRLKEQFELVGLKVKSGNGMGLKTMTGFLADLKLPYKIESRKVKVEGKQHTVWIIMDK